MRNKYFWLAAALTLLLFSCTGEKGEPLHRPPEQSDFSSLVKIVRPSVVNIRALNVTDNPYPDLFYRFFNQEPPEEEKRRALGTGVVVSRSGLIHARKVSFHGCSLTPHTFNFG